MAQILDKSMSRSRQKLEWTFLDVSTRKYTHAIHLYPARMHPEIARKVISKYAKKKSDIVLDPFMGSGGILLESILNGNNAVGIDINPFAVLLSKVKTTPITKNLTKELDKILKNSKNKKHYPDCLPTDYDLKQWFNPGTLKILATLKHSIFNIRDKDTRDFFKICLSLTVRKSSYQRNSAWKIHRLKEDKRMEFNPRPVDMFVDISTRKHKKNERSCCGRSIRYGISDSGRFKKHSCLP